MGEFIQLTTLDGHVLDAWQCAPKGRARGRLVIVQEIFGVNDHIREVCAGFAADGFEVIAPALFDRAARGVALAYDEEGFARGRALRAEVGNDNAARDIAAALAAFGDGPRAAVVGYCWGGALAWLAATRLAPACAVGYYGTQIVEYIHEHPQCPVMLHYGEKDPTTPPEQIARVRAAQPEAAIHVYPAGHGFNCDRRSDYHAESARLARERTLAFLAEHAAAG